MICIILKHFNCTDQMKLFLLQQSHHNFVTDEVFFCVRIRESARQLDLSCYRHLLRGNASYTAWLTTNQTAGTAYRHAWFTCSLQPALEMAQPISNSGQICVHATEKNYLLKKQRLAKAMMNFLIFLDSKEMKGTISFCSQTNLFDHLWLRLNKVNSHQRHCLKITKLNHHKTTKSEWNFDTYFLTKRHRVV